MTKAGSIAKLLKLFVVILSIHLSLIKSKFGSSLIHTLLKLWFYEQYFITTIKNFSYFDFLKIARSISKEVEDEMKTVEINLNINLNGVKETEISSGNSKFLI